MSKTKTQKHKPLYIPPIDKKGLTEELNWEKTQKRTIVLLMLLSFSIALLLGNLTYNFMAKNPLSPEQDTEEQVLGEGEEPEDVQFEPINKVAYKSEGNIWVLDILSSEVTQITKDGSAINSYTALAWKNKYELSLAKCSQQKCAIQTFNFEEDKITEEFEVDASQILALRWSHKGKALAYLCDTGLNLELDVKINTEVKNLSKFDRADNFYMDTNDAIYIRFSPNDERVMLVNTLAQGVDPPIVVFDLSGKEVLSVKKEKDTYSTFAFFMSNEMIYFKKDDYLYLRPFDSEEETQVTDRIIGAFDFQPSPDRTKLAYWTYGWFSGVSTVWIYEVGTGQVKRLRDYNAYPVWADDNTLIMIDFPYCRECLRDEYEFTGLSKMDLETKVVSDLVEFDEAEMVTVGNF